MRTLHDLVKLTAVVALAAVILPGCIFVPAHSIRAGGHVHGSGCGHVWRNGVWIVPFPLPSIHVHGPGCGHMFMDGCWMDMRFP